MVNFSSHDIISDLPESITEIILKKMPIRDAVRTSIVSSKWRYRWAGLTELVFDDDCVSVGDSDDTEDTEKKIQRFITRFLLLHQGPIHKFELCTAQYMPDIACVDQWILFVSRKDIKELILDIKYFITIPSCVFSCLKLTSLKLVMCDLNLPTEFKGFSCLKYLDLYEVHVSPGVIDKIISGAPRLEKLYLREMERLSLTVRAPNLKYLDMRGEFIDMCLEYTPLLRVIYADMDEVYYMYGDDADDVRESSGCKYLGTFEKFLDGALCLERLTGNITKYYSIGNDLGKAPITYDYIKLIDLHEVSFVELKERSVLL